MLYSQPSSIDALPVKVIKNAHSSNCLKVGDLQTVGLSPVLNECLSHLLAASSTACVQFQNKCCSRIFVQAANEGGDDDDDDDYNDAK